MEAMIDSGEEWLTPLLEFRDQLAETQDPARKHEFRDFRRRSGHVAFIGETDTPVPGPYTLEFCRTLLRRLLQAQVAALREAPPGEALHLIHDAELHEIRRIWRVERGDWEDSVPTIVREVLGRDLEWIQDDQVSVSGEDARLLAAACSKHGVPLELVARLVDVERSAVGLKRRHGVHSRIEEVLAQEWRDVEAVRAERRGALDLAAGTVGGAEATQ